MSNAKTIKSLEAAITKTKALLTSLEEALKVMTKETKASASDGKTNSKSAKGKTEKPAPKATAYNLFCEKKEEELRTTKKWAEATKKDVKAHLKELWDKASDKVKKPFVDAAEKDAVRYKKEMEALNKDKKAASSDDDEEESSEEEEKTSPAKGAKGKGKAKAASPKTSPKAKGKKQSKTATGEVNEDSDMVKKMRKSIGDDADKFYNVDTGRANALKEGDVPKNKRDVKWFKAGEEGEFRFCGGDEKKLQEMMEALALSDDDMEKAVIFDPEGGDGEAEEAEEEEGDGEEEEDVDE